MDKPAVILAVAAMLSTSCAAPAYERVCDERISEDECNLVTQAALGAIVDDPGDFGQLRRVEVTLVDDCTRAARGMMQPALADPAVIKCWAIRTRWQRGGPSVIVAQRLDGELVAFR
ncbi:MAG: hypothetical protein ACR2K4_02660 [Candidatus Limnocylindria bacterium]